MTTPTTQQVLTQAIVGVMSVTLVGTVAGILMGSMGAPTPKAKPSTQKYKKGR